MSIYVILGTPGAFDFQAFSDATRRSLALLAPLMELRSINSKVTNEIVVQVLAFARAIKLGAEAAQKGFTATEDIISLSELVDRSSPQERAEYLNGTLELASEAYTEGKEAFDVFRDVRTKIFSLSDKFNFMLQNPHATPLTRTRNQAEAARRSFEELKKGVDVLEAFGRHASALAQWWDWVKVETDVRGGGQTAVVFDDSSLKQKSVVDRWKLLRNQFADYTNMVGLLEDEYPELLSAGVVVGLAHQGRPSSSRPRPSKNIRTDLRRVLNLTRPKDTKGASSGCCSVQ
ncbi:hypothetical protein CPB84DRAFT_1850804 [Gymnopilus junonius]|uniref:Uncharacterized protein n=1 Tax=Gymnopilus junonius TaxID=109634 RepID=A0A9P5TJW1_GYMJU|nr:hypothetical protein CPB84DRAFT_1850804 [Gymnopilus junonius]